MIAKCPWSTGCSSHPEPYPQFVAFLFLSPFALKPCGRGWCVFSAGAVVPVLLCWWGSTSKAFYVASVGYNMCPVVPVRHCTRISRHRVAMPVASQLSPPTLVNMQRTQAALRLVAPSGLPCVLADLDPTSAVPANQEVCECGDRMLATLSVSGLHC